MKSLYLFNPENDLALACNRRNYSPPRNALELRRSGALLPLWYCTAGDAVLVESMPDTCWLDAIRGKFGIDTSVVTAVPDEVVRAVPWGWSLAARSEFLAAGMREELLPDEECIRSMRELSHRRLTVSILDGMKSHGLYHGELPVELHNSVDVLHILNTYGNDGIYLKAPWSSTGRGVIPGSGKSDDNIMMQAAGIIKRQGSVMVEQAFRKVRDFAMLFRSAPGVGVRYVGLSLFDTSSQSYTGNILASESRLRNILSGDISTEDTDRVREAIIPLLDNLIGDRYEGYFGVDMMVVDINGQHHIHPCVEVNLRMTMGVVAHKFTRNYLADDVTGTFRVEFGETAEATEPVIVDGKLVRGTLRLVPSGGKFSITATVS
ncbi:MAG: hypothetical protein K2M07_07445 [Muribaculaceae bacterium]|nr:hypothetical protein [Muribaculaceae bacterium]